MKQQIREFKVTKAACLAFTQTPPKTAAFTKKWTLKPSHSCRRNAGRTLSLAMFPTLTSGRLPFYDTQICFTSRLINWKVAFRMETGTRCIPPIVSSVVNTNNTRHSRSWNGRDIKQIVHYCAVVSIIYSRAWISTCICIRAKMLPGGNPIVFGWQVMLMESQTPVRQITGKAPERRFYTETQCADADTNLLHTETRGRDAVYGTEVIHYLLISARRMQMTDSFLCSKTVDKQEDW